MVLLKKNSADEIVVPDNFPSILKTYVKGKDLYIRVVEMNESSRFFLFFSLNKIFREPYF